MSCGVGVARTACSFPHRERPAALVPVAVCRVIICAWIKYTCLPRRRATQFSCSSSSFYSFCILYFVIFVASLHWWCCRFVSCRVILRIGMLRISRTVIVTILGRRRKKFSCMFSSYTCSAETSGPSQRRLGCPLLGNTKDVTQARHAGPLLQWGLALQARRRNDRVQPAARIRPW